MAQAKPGKIRQIRTITTTFTPPTQPPNLSASQVALWNEITANPYLTNQDQSAVVEYIKMTVLRDVAFESLQTDGIMIDGKKNPAYSIWRDTSDRLLKLRDSLLMTPKSRLQAHGTVIQSDEPEDEMKSLVD